MSSKHVFSAITSVTMLGTLVVASFFSTVMTTLFSTAITTLVSTAVSTFITTSITTIMVSFVSSSLQSNNNHLNHCFVIFMCIVSLFDGVERHVQPYFSSIVAVSFIGGGNRWTDKHYHIMLYTSPWSRFELTTAVVIGTNCIRSCKFNYHTLTGTMVPFHVWCKHISNMHSSI